MKLNPFDGLEVAVSIMNHGPHLFSNLLLPSRVLHQYQIMLLCDRGKRVCTTGPLDLLRS